MPRGGRKEHGFQGMKKERTRQINQKTAATLVCAFALLLVGALCFVFGQSAYYPPMLMAAWLQFCIAAMLLFGIGGPALLECIRQKLAFDAQLDVEAAKKAAQEELAAQKPTDGKKKKKKKAPKHLFKPYRLLLEGILRWGNVLVLVIELLLLAVFAFFYITYVAKTEAGNYLNYLHVVILAASVAALLILSRVFKYFAPDAKIRASYTAILDVLRFNLLILTVGTVINVTGLLDASAVMLVIQYIVAVYSALFLLLSLVNAFLRGQCATGMMLTIPRPFAKQEQDEEDLVTYLERSTGITLRSLFGIKVAKKILPVVLLGVVFCFWLTTGITQIEPYERGALYRFGKCEKILEPGIHLSLPYPFDKVEVYQTEKVQEMVVGYESADKTNLLWTESHGGTEYKLLLGDGSELVSVNLRVKYKIDDLREYVTCSAEPAQILNAKAYAVVTDITVKTKLDDILEEDRTALSQTIEGRLAAYLDTAACGLEVCDVIIESIHPPVEVSQVYQQVVSATLAAQAQIDNAEGMAVSKISFAELQKNALIQKAQINQNEQVAAANASVAEFMAMVGAYNDYPDTFCYYKYLNTLAKVYKNQRLYIVGDGIDEGYLYFGDGVIIYQKNQTGG